LYDIFHVPGIIAPAGKLRPDKFDTGVAYLRATGREPRFGAHVNGPSDTAYLSADAEARAKLWYSTGTQAIFACGTKVFAAVASAAERNIGSWVIGADTDKSYVSDAVLTTAEKSVSMSVYRALESVKNGSFSGGRSVKFGIADDGVRLDLSRSAFNLFTQSDYDAIVARIKADPTMISSLVTAEDIKSTVLGDESELSSLFSLNCVILSVN